VQNVTELCRYSQKKIIAVVKSDAYGIGVEYIAPLLQGLPQVEAFAVASAEEGVSLREMGIKKEIIILGGILREEVEAIKSYKLTPVVSDREHLELLKGKNVKFHVKYDTGMGRLGFTEDILIRDHRITGIMSHLSTPADREFSLYQIKKFENIVKKYKGSFKIHIESSAGIIYKVPYTTHTRIGLALYGEKPLRNYPINIKPVLELKARVISVKEIPPKHPISYGRTYTAPCKMRIGIVAFGYGDGLIKSLSNRGYLFFEGEKLPIVGNITMDMTIVDLKNSPVCVGDWITVVGPEQSFGDLARCAGTIPYEIMCNISQRVKRKII